MKCMYYEYSMAEAQWEHYNKELDRKDGIVCVWFYMTNFDRWSMHM